MRNILLLVFSLPLLAGLQANVQISARQTTAFNFKAQDAWNIDVIYSGTSDVNAIIRATIANSQNLTVAVLNSPKFLLKKGYNNLNPDIMMGSSIDYLSGAIAEIEQLTGSFPSGLYKVCYSISCATPDCDGQGARAIYQETPFCTEYHIENPTPLLLASPDDKAVLEFKRPNFYWIPPMPLSNVRGFSYNYTLVEARKDQSCPDAVLGNRPIYKGTDILNTSLNFPGEIDDLDTGKRYCWKVDGMVEGQNVAQSEVWEFTIKPEEEVIPEMVVLKPKKNIKLESHEFGTKDTLTLVFDQKYTKEEQSFWRIQLEGSDIESFYLKPELSNNVHNGKDQVMILPDALGELKQDQYYTIKVYTLKNDILKVRLHIK